MDLKTFIALHHQAHPSHRLGQCCATSSRLHPNGGGLRSQRTFCKFKSSHTKSSGAVFSLFFFFSEDCVLVLFLSFLHKVLARQAASVDAIQDVFFHCDSLMKKVRRTRSTYFISIWTDLYIQLLFL